MCTEHNSAKKSFHVPTERRVARSSQVAHHVPRPSPEPSTGVTLACWRGETADPAGPQDTCKSHSRAGRRPRPEHRLPRRRHFNQTGTVELVNFQGILPNSKKGNKSHNFSRLPIETTQDKRRCSDVTKVPREKPANPGSHTPRTTPFAK